MAVMESQGLISWTMAHPDAATALATMALVAVGLFIGLLQIGIVWHGIRKMVDTGEKRDERFQKSMDAEADRHKESMKALNALIRNSGRRNRPVPAR